MEREEWINLQFINFIKDIFLYTRVIFYLTIKIEKWYYISIFSIRNKYKKLLQIIINN